MRRREHGLGGRLLGDLSARAPVRRRLRRSGRGVRRRQQRLRRRMLRRVQEGGMRGPPVGTDDLGAFADRRAARRRPGTRPVVAERRLRHRDPCPRALARHDRGVSAPRGGRGSRDDRCPPGAGIALDIAARPVDLPGRVRKQRRRAEARGRQRDPRWRPGGGGDADRPERVLPGHVCGAAAHVDDRPWRRRLGARGRLPGPGLRGRDLQQQPGGRAVRLPVSRRRAPFFLAPALCQSTSPMAVRFPGGVTALVLATLLLPGLAAAGNISISISPTAELREGALVATVQVSNSGDEAAHAVTPTLHFRDKEVRSTPREQLAPKETMRAELSVPVGELGAGRWPYRMAVDYADANQYPFQALHVGALVQGNPPPAKVSVIGIEAGPLAGSGSLHARVKNLAGTQRDVAITVVLPEGVEVADPVHHLVLAPWQETGFSSSLVNRTALAGSRYPVFVITEYDDDGVHQLTVGHGSVEVTNPGTFFSSQRTLLWILAGILVVGWIAFLAWQLATGRLRRAVPP